MPPFNPNKARYDLDTFLGRTLNFYSINDPRTLLFSTAEMMEAKKLLKQYKEGTHPPGTTDEQLWHARRVVESAVHPDTGEVIPAIMRFSAFVPVNMFIVSATLSPLVIGSFPATAFVNWLNQTYNASINYANRNASNPVPTELLMQGYAGAVATSVSIGMTATYLTKLAASRGPGVAGLIRSTLPFLASAGAGSANVALMRRNELVQGVDMYDHEGQNRGKSVVAGKTGIAKCAAARVIWNIPIMMVPPLIMTRLEKTAFMQGNPRIKVATEIALITSCLLGAVSPALAIFPQRDCLDTATLEPELRGLKDSKGAPVAKLWYNKGL